MSTVFVTQNIWPQLTKAARGSRKRCDVAVAYFGKGASRLLPLPSGSRLVVDAGEHAVKSGQTCPADLIKLQNRGVIIYSSSNLHAKVFVLGDAAYIGSANVSSRSASQLIEAVIRTTDTTTVNASRKFVVDHCLRELTPTVLTRLAKLYRPPRIPGGRQGRRREKMTPQRPTLPPVFIAQIHPEDWSERDVKLHDSALPVAKRRRRHPRSFELDSIRWTGICHYRREDIIIQVFHQDRDRIVVMRPAEVLHVRTRRDGRRRVSFVYLERPGGGTRSLRVLARRLGQGASRRLRRNGIIRDKDFKEALLKELAG